MKQKKFFNPQSFACHLTILVMALVLAGCQSTNRLREAQDSFNAAAALENSAQLEPLIGKPGLEAQLQKPAQNALADLSTARSGYAAAQFDEPRIAFALRRLRHLSFDLPEQLQGYVAKTSYSPTLSHCRDEIQRPERAVQPAAFCRALTAFAIAIRHNIPPTVGT